VNLRPIDVYIMKRQLRWVGYVSRMSFDRLPRKMLSCWGKNRCTQIYLWTRAVSMPEES